MSGIRSHLVYILIGTLLLTTSLTGCRYWSMYRFGKQFCEFDAYIAVLTERTGQGSQSLVISFANPILKRHILQRYLAADPYSITRETYRQVDHFNLAFSADGQMETKPDLANPFWLKTIYTEYDDHPVLSGAQISPAFSQAFPKSLVEQLLRSFCTEDIDVNSDFVDMKFEVPELASADIPSLSQIQSVFGPFWESTSNLDGITGSWRLSFTDENHQPQDKLISIEVTSQKDELSAVNIKYHKYDYDIDLRTGIGSLRVTRS